MSDLLNKASLVMIPSGYKEDTVFSQLPQDGSGDLSFTRASNGTRVNSAGLVEVAPWNLATYSEDLSNSAWTKGGTTVTANATTAPNGTTTADKLVELATTEQHQSYLSIPVNAGQYTYSVYLKQAGRIYASVYPQGSSMNAVVTVNLSTGVIVSATGATYVSSSIESVGDGWYRVSATLNTTANNLACVVYLSNVSGGQSPSYTGDGTSGIYIWGAQLNIGSTAKPYFPTTDRLNVPRLTYQNGGGGCPSLLLEKQSTNLLTYSEEFDNSAWTKNGGTITANTTISPDGTQNADTLTGASGNYRIYQIVGGLSSIDYTFSVFAKKGTANLIWFDFINVGDGPSFNFTTKAWSSASGWTTSYEEHANGWFRLIATKASNTTSAGLGIKVGGVDETVYIWGAQMEASSYATSYIGTTSSSATRVADACYKNSISSLIGQSSGVVFADIIPFQFFDGSYIGISDNASASNRQIFGFEGNSGNSGTLRFYGWYSGGYGTFYAGQRYKIAMAYGNNDFVVYVNGTQVVNQTSGTVTGTLSHFGFDSYVANSQNFQGQVNQAILFPTRLTNAELASLTTL